MGGDDEFLFFGVSRFDTTMLAHAHWIVLEHSGGLVEGAAIGRAGLYIWQGNQGTVEIFEQIIRI